MFLEKRADCECDCLCQLRKAFLEALLGTDTVAVWYKQMPGTSCMCVTVALDTSVSETIVIPVYQCSAGQSLVG